MTFAHGFGGLDKSVNLLVYPLLTFWTKINGTLVKISMKVSGYKIHILIIIGIALTLNLWKINFMSENRRKSNTNMPLSQNLKKKIKLNTQKMSY